MHRPQAPTVRWPRRLVAVAAAAVGALALTTTAASAATGPGFYALQGAPGSTFQVLSKGNLVNVESDDTIFPLSTSGTGTGRLPFAVHAYNQTYTNIAIDSNGNVQLGVTKTQAFSRDVNDCMPTRQFGHPVVAPYWDDLIFHTADTSHGFPDGVFTRTSGTAPHRTFLVSWQGVELNTNRPVLAQVAFHEGSQTLTFTYGTDGGASATVGVQSKQGLSSDQWSCNSGSSASVTNGLRIGLVHHNGQEPAA